MTPEQIRAALIRAKARQFAAMVRETQMAHKVPDEIIDWLDDAEIPAFFEHSRGFRITQREDKRWEPRL